MRICLIFILVFASFFARSQERCDSVQAYPQAISDYDTTHSDVGETIRHIQQVNWPRVLTKVGVKVALRLTIDQVLKNNVRQLRPDGSDYRSFPSRHSSWAYGIAGTATYWFGQQSPWVAFAAQSAANAVGFQRVMTRRHYPGDVMAGAGIGLATDLAGIYISNLIFGGESHFPDWRRSVNDFRPRLSVSTAASFPFSQYIRDLRVGTALMTTYRWQTPATDWAGLSFAASLMSSPVKRNGERICLRPLNSLRFGLGPALHFNSGGPFSVSACAEGGYQANLKVRGYEVNSGSAYVSLSLQASMMATRNLAFGVDASVSSYKLEINQIERKLGAASVGFFSQILF